MGKLSDNRIKLQDKKRHRSASFISGSKIKSNPSVSILPLGSEEIYQATETYTGKPANLLNNMLFYGETLARVGVGAAIVASSESMRKLSEFKDKILDEIERLL